MYNTDIPARAELPTSKQLLRSTFIAIVSAVVILVTVVLPAEYAIDPTGIGRSLGLAKMAEIKIQLKEEAELDRARIQKDSAPAGIPSKDERSSLLGNIFAQLVIGSAAAQEALAARSDEVSVTLKPGESAEIKLTMNADARANFSWTAAGGVVNFDLHGDGDGQSTSYERGRAVSSAKGVLEAAFDGNHGWFWRNRGQADVTITLRTNGDYADIKQMF